MKKFYEAPVVELTGFSAEDIITTSSDVTAINADNYAAFESAFTGAYAGKESYGTADYGSYTW